MLDKKINSVDAIILIAALSFSLGILIYLNNKKNKEIIRELNIQNNLIIQKK